MEIEVIQSQYYGRTGELEAYRAEMKNFNVPYSRRKAAAQSFYKIIAQCNDKKLMSMRQRLIRAAQAGDREWVGRISFQMKKYLGEDAESGIYET